MIKSIFLISFISIVIFSCNVKDNNISSSADISSNQENIIISETLNSNSIVNKYNSILDEAKQKYGYDSYNDYILIANTEEQKMYLIQNDILIEEYIISTGKAGEGNIKNSNKTPLGFHKIIEKIGTDAPIGTIFIAKQNTGQISKIYTDNTDTDNDPVVTRILHLDGLEAGYNKGGNVDSYSRYIYIHGTHEEGLLGTKASHGCIRMSNSDVISLFRIIPNQTIVYITSKTS